MSLRRASDLRASQAWDGMRIMSGLGDDRVAFLWCLGVL